MTLPEGGVSTRAARAVPTMRALWVEVGDQVARIGHPGPWEVRRMGEALLAWASRVDVLIQNGVVDLNEDPRLRRGNALELRREPGGPWAAAGLELPLGARWSPATRPLACARGLEWTDAGFRYRWQPPGRPTVLRRGAPETPVKATAPAVPDDATSTRKRIAGLVTIAHRIEGDRIRGWLRDGAVVVAGYTPSSGNS